MPERYMDREPFGFGFLGKANIYFIFKAYRCIPGYSLQGHSKLILTEFIYLIK